jgi:hypothetical protein
MSRGLGACPDGGDVAFGGEPPAHVIAHDDATLTTCSPTMEEVVFAQARSQRWQPVPQVS